MHHTFEGIDVTVTARRYVSEGTSSYSAEIELPNGCTHIHVRRLLRMFLSVFGSVGMMRNEVDGDGDFMASVGSADHAVVDVSDLSSHMGTFMLKANGMKIYIFCYSFGYVVTLTDTDLTVVSCTFVEAEIPLFDITKTPGVMVGEMLMNGTIVYIDTLCRNGEARLTAQFLMDSGEVKNRKSYNKTICSPYLDWPRHTWSHID
jgi:hypothetical protein